MLIQPAVEFYISYRKYIPLQILSSCDILSIIKPLHFKKESNHIERISFYVYFRLRKYTIFVKGAQFMHEVFEQLLSQEGLMFDSDPASPEAVDSILAAMQIGMEMAKKKNKEKYTPKKYLSNIDKKQD